jgi:hypothetical protein
MSNLKDETSYMSPALCKRRFFCVDCLRHPFAFAIHQNGVFGGWDMEGPTQKLHPFGCTWPLFAKITFVVM